MSLFIVTVFLSAFLLFQIQPLIGRYILPWFGGAPGVWITCLLTFQLLLVAGYFYAHVIITRLKPRQQVIVHILLMACTIFLLPITPGIAWKSSGPSHPTFHVMLVLLATVGGPYFLLSSTAPLVQHWFAVSFNRSPYRLYAISNAGSLLGLLAYPLALEPFLKLQQQGFGWSGSYVLAIVLIAMCGLRLIRKRTEEYAPPPGTELPSEPYAEKSASPESKTPVFDRVMWVLLSACGSAMLLVTTGQVLENVASVPLLWVVPLLIYLLSFVVCFGWKRYYLRWAFVVAYVIAVIIALIALYGPITLVGQIIIYMSVLWVCCSICHGELFHSKPAARDLSLFYMAVAVGGALGGVLSALVAPRVFADHQIDFVVVLFAVAMLLALQSCRDRWQTLDGKRLQLVVRMQLFAFIVVSVVGVFGTASIPTRAAIGAQGDLIAQERNFYGALQIFENGRVEDGTLYRLMVHGNTMHGVQAFDSALRTQPTSYFCIESGAGRILQTLDQLHVDKPLRIGVIGLGIGTLASYGRAGDEFVFFELDEKVVALCERHFTYLSDARSRGVRVEVITGDARISLERLAARKQLQDFDLLVVDAFSGDAVPCHLLTKEGADIYWQHVKPGGSLLFNVTNRYVDLAPVVKALADVVGKSALLLEYGGIAGDRLSPDGFLNGMSSRWIVVSANKRLLRHQTPRHLIKSWRGVRPLLWTDDHYSVLQVLRGG